LSRLRFLTLATVLAGGLIGCSAAPVATAPPTPVNARCGLADFNITGQLLAAVQTGYSVRNVYYVRSNDFDHTLFLAGDIQGPGLEGSQDIGVWAINLANGSNTFYEMNDLAGSHGGWIPGPHAGYSMSDDGVAEVQQCALAAGAAAASPAAS